MTQTGHAETLNSAIRKVATAVGAVFLLVGILGFIPGITTQFSEMSLAGRESEALLLGLFQVSVLHNIIHLLFGVLAWQWPADPIPHATT